MYATALVGYVARLYVRASRTSCGCHPWAGPINRASFIPAAAVLVTAGAGLGCALDASFDVVLSRDAWTFGLAVVSGGTALVVAGALASPLDQEDV